MLKQEIFWQKITKRKRTFRWNLFSKKFQKVFRKFPKNLLLSEKPKGEPFELKEPFLGSKRRKSQNFLGRDSKIPRSAGESQKRTV